MNKIKSLSRNKSAVQLARFFHLGSFLKSLHFRFFHPKDYVLSLGFEDILARFYAKNYQDMNTLETILIEGEMDERAMLRSLLESLQPGEVALDVGAYQGLHSVFMAKKVGHQGKVIAFEPDPRNFKTLEANIRLNGLSQILPVPLALGDRLEDKPLFHSRRMTGASNSLIQMEGSDLSQSVRVIPGDDFLSREDLPSPNVVKIDVEGYEYPVLKGLSKTLRQETVRRVCCEIHSPLFPPGTTLALILDLLKSLGFVKIETATRGGQLQAVCSRLN